MPCTKCRSDFNFFNWKIKCGECNDKYCTKCLRKTDGVLYCEKCIILLTRPPDPAKLMKLKPKELQDYLTKHNISTYGLVEKQELVDLFCHKHIPVNKKRGAEKLAANFAGSVPNLRPTEAFNDFLSGIESVLPGGRPFQTLPNQTRPAPNPDRRPPVPKPPRPSAPPVEPQPTTSSAPPAEPTSGPTPPKYPKLSDYGSVEDLGKLSAKDLKTLLTLYRVDYKGCVEKVELLERAERLWSDNNKLKTEEMSENLEDLCKLCMDAPLDCVLLECGHIATCIDCGKKLSECPICRQYVIRVVRTFKA